MEEILPKGDIQNAFDFAVQQLQLPIAEPVNFSNDDRVVSQIAGAYLVKNRVAKEESNLFEQTFKDRLFTVIAETLKEPALITDLETRRKAFIERFPQYHDSVSKIILKAPSKAESQVS